jgi:hypothetical protein
VERANSDSILVCREPGPEPTHEQRTRNADENRDAVPDPGQAQDGVQKREKGSNSQSVPEPVPVEDRITSRLPGEGPVVVGVHTGLQERAQALMDVAGLSEVVGETGRETGRERRDAVEDPAAPRLVHK